MLSLQMSRGQRQKWENRIVSPNSSFHERSVRQEVKSLGVIEPKHHC